MLMGERVHSWQADTEMKLSIRSWLADVGLGTSNSILGLLLLFNTSKNTVLKETI